MHRPAVLSLGIHAGDATRERPHDLVGDGVQRVDQRFVGGAPSPLTGSPLPVPVADLASHDDVVGSLIANSANPDPGAKRPALVAAGRLPPDLGVRVVSARVDAGLTRIALSSAAGVAPRTLARIERGAQRPTPATLRALAAALGVTLDDLAPNWGRDEDERLTSGAVAPGVAIRVLRRRCGLTQADLAAAAGVSVATVSRFERAMHARARDR